jgi:hypothetical protein
MSLVNSSIANLVNGVSQQPYALRLPSQCEEQINCLSSVVEGLRRRPPTRHEFRILEDQFATADVLDHQIDRDSTEQYKVFITDKSIRAFNLNTRQEVPVTFKNGRQYLNCGKPSRDLRAVTVADHTFIVNRTKKVLALPDLIDAYRPEALIWVRQGAYGCKYRVSLDGNRVIWTTPDGDGVGNDKPPREEGDDTDTIKTDYNPTPPAIDTDGKTSPHMVATEYIAQQLMLLLRNHPKLTGKYSFDIKGSVVRIRSIAQDTKDGRVFPNFTIYGSDSMGDTVLRVLKDRTRTLTDLPARCFDDFRIKIVGDSSTNFDDYYVRYNGDVTAGVWIEDRADQQRYKLDPSTMPYVLVRQEDGTFSFERAEWDERKVGDVKSNPLPSFINRKIADLFFFSNRLGFIAEDKVVMSRFGDFYNFFKASATQVLDTDPIDVAVSHTKAIDLQHAVAYQETLTLFSDGVQFQLRDAETTTAKTVGFTQTTEYNCSKAVRPVANGAYLYFTHERGENGSAVREYRVNKSESANTATDITAHVPKYIKGNIVTMASSPSENIIVATGGRQKNVLYVYEFYWQDDAKIQNSWSRWVFEEGTDILSASFIGSTLWVSVIRGTTLTIESADLSPVVNIPGQDFDIFLDRRFDHRMVTPDYSANRKETTIRSPYGVHDNMIIIASGGGVDDFSEGYKVSWFERDGNIIVDGRLKEFYIGVYYESRYTFSTLIMRQQASNGESKSVVDGRLQLRKMTLEYSNSGYFRVEVTPVRRQTYVYPFTGKTTGLFTNRIGRVNIASGHHQFPLLSKNDQVSIEIVNDNHLPFAILSADWEGVYVTRSRRV